MYSEYDLSNERPQDEIAKMQARIVQQNAQPAKANDNERLFSLTFRSRTQAIDFLKKVRDLQQYRLVLTGERTLEVWPGQPAGSNLLYRFLELLQVF
jgi:hypothetical protein